MATVNDGKVLILGAGGPVGAATIEALKNHYQLRVTDARPLAEAALELGFYISCSGIVTFKNAEDLRGIIRDVPLDRLIVETDSPVLAPIPNRGKRNEPSFVVHTAEKIAELKGLNMAEFSRISTENFFRLFAKAVPPASGTP